MNYEIVKFGEIFGSTDYKYYLVVCTLCKKSYKSLTLFIHHRLRQHINVNNDSKESDVTEDINLDENQINYLLAKDKNEIDEEKEISIRAVLEKYYESNKDANKKTEPNYEVINNESYENNKDLYCNKCNVHFEKKIELRFHKCRNNLEEINEEKTYECNYCNQSYNQRINVLKHEETHTRIERKFKCNLCEKSFIYNWNLVVHKRIHGDSVSNGIKSCNSDNYYYNVSNCNNSCNISSCSFQYLTEKFNQIELGYNSNGLTTGDNNFEKPFKCEICNKSFLHDWNLNLHRRTHLIKTDKEYYQCKYCKNTFTDKTIFYSHKRKHFDALCNKKNTCNLQ